MLLYHGTRANHLTSIMRDGLQPSWPDDTSHDWVHAMTNRSQRAQVYLSTEPVAGRGGDPVSFALGWPNKRERFPHAVPGYLIVVDLPSDALGHIRAVVANYELDQFIAINQARDTWTRHAFTHLDEANAGQFLTCRLTNWCLLTWLERRFAASGQQLTAASLAASLQVVIAHREPTLPTDMTPARWRAFMADYGLLIDVAYRDGTAADFERRRRAILARHGVTLPAYIEEDHHCVRCGLCVGGLFRYTYQFTGLAADDAWQAFLRQWQYQHGGMQPTTGNQALDVVCLPGISSPSYGGQGDAPLVMALEALRALAAYQAIYGEDEIERFFLEHETGKTQPWTWNDWHAAFPADGTTVPRQWQPNYGRNFTPLDLKRPDRQVLADTIPAQYIIGAIRLSDGVRLAPRVRPNRRAGTTLPGRLHRLALEIRKAYRGTPIILD